jgi:crystallin, alpha B
MATEAPLHPMALHRTPLHRSLLPFISHHRPSHVTKDGSFEVSVDLQHFHSSDIKVKLVDHKIVVEGKHEEREDEHGFVERHFKRRYSLPEGYDPETVTSTLSSDGVLTLKAPPLSKQKGDEMDAMGHRKVEIVHTGKKHPAMYPYYQYHEDRRG